MLNDKHTERLETKTTCENAHHQKTQQTQHTRKASNNKAKRIQELDDCDLYFCFACRATLRLIHAMLKPDELPWATAAKQRELGLGSGIWVEEHTEINMEHEMQAECAEALHCAGLKNYHDDGDNGTWIWWIDRVYRQNVGFQRLAHGV